MNDRKIVKPQIEKDCKMRNRKIFWSFLRKNGPY